MFELVTRYILFISPQGEVLDCIKENSPWWSGRKAVVHLRDTMEKHPIGTYVFITNYLEDKVWVSSCRVIAYKHPDKDQDLLTSFQGGKVLYVVKTEEDSVAARIMEDIQAQLKAYLLLGVDNPSCLITQQ